MIPFIRSFTELMAITEYKGNINRQIESEKLSSLTLDSGQRKRYLRSIRGKRVETVGESKRKRPKWINGKERQRNKQS